MIEAITDPTHPLEPPPSVERLAHTLATAARDARPHGRPFLVELAGTPRAGKTTTMDALTLCLRRQGLEVGTVTEQAAECPLRNKRNPFYNVWTACSTLAGVLEARDAATHVVVVDRGLFDAACWMDWYRETGQLTGDECETIERFLLLPRWASVGGLVVALTTDPAVALEREWTQGIGWDPRGVPSSIMNDSTLTQFNEAVRRVRARRSELAPVHVDTSMLSPDDVLCAVMQAALDRLRERTIPLHW